MQNRLRMSPLPQNVRSKLCIYFCGPMPRGKYNLVTVDVYSRLPITAIVLSTSASIVPPIIDKIFVLLGIPEVLKTDNDPSCQSSQFSDFANYLNAESECFIKKHRENVAYCSSRRTYVEIRAISLVKKLQGFATHEYADTFSETVIWKRLQNKAAGGDS